MKSKLLFLEGAKLVKVKEINKGLKDEKIRLTFDNGYELEIPSSLEGIVLLKSN